METTKNKENMTTIEVKADGKSGMYGGAFCLAFVYSTRGNFLVKGYHREVKKYIKENFTKGFVNYSLWCNDWRSKSRVRCIWDFIGERFTIFEPKAKSKYQERTKWRIYDSHKKEVVLKFKRLPKTWIPELNNLYK